MKRTTWFLVLGIAALIGASGAGTLWAFTHSDSFATRVISAALPNQKSFAAIVPRVLGFEHPNTVLFLFLNNAELRPGGGFIGSYGVVTMDHGVPSKMHIAGTEKLDDVAPSSFVVQPPQAMRTYMQSDRWFFRDSNWSPDFVTNAQRALQFYSAEGGEQANDIHTVVAITPEVLAAIMKYTGPVTIDDKQFTAENIADLLQYAVEVDFTHKQIPTEQRKEILSKLAGVLATKIATLPPTKWGPLVQDAFQLIAERHVMVYDIDPAVQNSLDAMNWSGRMLPGTPDKLQIVDANLAALKTDRVVDRTAAVSLVQNKSGAWEETVTLTYKHNGGFDYRTTRYRSYVRVFVPGDAAFAGGTGAMSGDKINKKDAAGDFAVEHEDGMLSVGAFISVEPGASHTVTFRFTPSPAVLGAIAARHYNLYVQKQSGVPQFNLTLHADFGTSIGQGAPPESPDHFGDSAYDWTGTLTTDKQFSVTW